jgi:hypothetical protein
MADAPERIWAWPVPVKTVCEGEWASEAGQGVEYVRADLLERAVQTALEMAATEAWHCGGVEAGSTVRAISVEDVMERLEGEP